MGYVIALAGKGGTGKTTIAALLVRLIKEKRLGSVLAVDADPNSNLAETLGVSPRQTVGALLDAICAHPETVPPGMPKERFIEYEIQSSIDEGEGFDILTMGRPEGPGCYCYVNNCLRGVMEKLIKDYDYVVIDNEAGLEHLSRRTTRYADALVVVSDPTAVGLRSAGRIRQLIKELDITTRKNLLIVNRCEKGVSRETAKDLGLDFLGCIPSDSQISALSLKGDSLWKLDDNAESITVLRKSGESIWQLN
jgi:CO dehydrogenase maturation factor